MSLCILTTYFNPLGYRSKRDNYLAFRAAMETSRLPVLTIEQAADERDFNLEESPDIVRIRGGDLLFQKERLLNLLLPTVPDTYRFIAWVDCDVLFENPDWASDSVKVLGDRLVAVQPFETAWWLQRGATAVAEGCDEHSRSFGAIYQEHPLQVRRIHGHTGFAWVMRRSVLDKLGFYDAAVFGGGDALAAHAFVGDVGSAWVRRISGASPQSYAHFLSWARRAFALVSGRVGCVQGRALHLWHGDLRNRQYADRHERMRCAGFDPDQHLSLDESGLWRWTEGAAALRAFAYDYFSGRDEDGAGQGVE